MDVYFASLKQETVAQEKAYGALNFLSKWCWILRMTKNRNSVTSDMLILLIMKSYNIFSSQQRSNKPHIWSVGDAGGYMGLLIGASCLTLCEVLDLFLYNCFLKLISKYKRRRISPVVNMDTGKANFDRMNNSHFQTKCYVDTLPKIVDWRKYPLIDLRTNVHACYNPSSGLEMYLPICYIKILLKTIAV